MNPTIAAILARYPSAAACAAALSISRQALSQAIKRGRLSESATIRAAEILAIDPGRALLERATAPVSKPAANLTPERDKRPDLYYVKPNKQQKSNHGTTKKNSSIHNITSQEQRYAVEIVRWCLAVAKLPADSPRFAYYVSRWNIPGKVARAKADGTLDTMLQNCPPIEPGWIRYVPAALDEWRRFEALHTRPKAEQAQYSGTLRRVV